MSEKEVVGIKHKVKLFVYGTLKRGGRLNNWMRDQNFICNATTVPQYRLHTVGGFPGLVENKDDGESIHGELWEVSEDFLPTLDQVEAVGSGLFGRGEVELSSPGKEKVVTYLYKGYLDDCPVHGNCW